MFSQEIDCVPNPVLREQKQEFTTNSEKHCSNLFCIIYKHMFKYIAFNTFKRTELLSKNCLKFLN